MRRNVRGVVRRREAARPPTVSRGARAAAAHRNTDAGPDRIVCLLCGETYRAIGYWHLKRVHGFDGAHPVWDYKERFGLRVAMCEESCGLLKDVQIVRHKRAGRHWTQARILGEIRSRRETEHGLALSRVPVALGLVAVRRFGSWDEAVRRAGVDPVLHRLTRAWDRDRVLSETRRLARGCERLSSVVVQRTAPRLYRAAVGHFRNWTTTLKAAGLDPAAHREPRLWSGDRVESWIRRTHAAGGDIRSSAAPSGAVGRLAQVSELPWSLYVESLGIVYPGRQKRLDWTDDAVLAQIRGRQRRGLSLNAAAVAREAGQGLPKQARSRFGSWGEALRRAGLDPDRICKARAWTRASVIAAIRERARTGKPLRRRDVLVDDRRLVKAASRLFPASWTKAVAAAGVSDARLPRGRQARGRGQRGG